MSKDRLPKRTATLAATVEVLEDRQLMSGALPTHYATHSAATSQTQMHASQGIVTASPSSVAAPGSVLSLESNGPTRPVNPSSPQGKLIPHAPDPGPQRSLSLIFSQVTISG